MTWRLNMLTAMVASLAAALLAATGGAEETDPSPAFKSTAAQVTAAKDTAAQDTAAQNAANGLSANELVEQLGSGSYRDRNRATQELARLGLEAKEALLRGLEDPDAEVRWRCQRVLGRVLELDFRARLKAFVADTQSQDAHGLAGWERFRQVVGSSRAARELFVEMHEAEAALLESSRAGPDATSLALEQRCTQMQQSLQGRRANRQRGQLSLGTVATLFFLSSDRDVAISDQVANWLNRISYESAFQTAIRSGTRVELMRKLLGAWIGRATGSFIAYPSLILALNYDLPEGLEPATSLLKQGGVQPQIVQYAILVVGRFGNKEHLPDIEPLLQEAAICVTSQNKDQPQYNTEVRDVALAVLLQLTGQKFADYGFDRLEKNPKTLFNPASLGFADDDKRAKALEKWKAWRGKN